MFVPLNNFLENIKLINLIVKFEIHICNHSVTRNEQVVRMPSIVILKYQ